MIATLVLYTVSLVTWLLAAAGLVLLIMLLWKLFAGGEE